MWSLETIGTAARKDSISGRGALSIVGTELMSVGTLVGCAKRGRMMLASDTSKRRREVRLTLTIIGAGSWVGGTLGSMETMQLAADCMVLFTKGATGAFWATTMFKSRDMIGWIKAGVEG